jgi:hypothetical protein
MIGWRRHSYCFRMKTLGRTGLRTQSFAMAMGAWKSPGQGQGWVEQVPWT